MSKTCPICHHEYDDETCNYCEEYPPIPDDTPCEYCDSPAEYWAGDNVVCEYHHDQYVKAFRKSD